MTQRRFIPPSVLLLLALAGGVASAEAPVAVSPGHASKLALVEARCPTFSWGEVEGAKSYELVVYRVGEQGERAQPSLQQSFAGAVDSWTPSLDRCLERGGQYAWSVRAVGGHDAPEWSSPSLFEVAAGRSEAEFEAAVAVVRQYLAEEETGSVEGSVGAVGSLSGASATPVARSPGEAAVEPSPLSVAMGDSALQVNGAAVVTTATLAEGVGAQLCLAIDYRFVDQGDGTVRDCNTGLIWLKNADCLSGGTWDQAESDTAGLESGECGLTDGSSPGDWRQPTISELCSAHPAGVNPCPSGAASDSLIDSSVSGSPKVVNAKGDAKWSAGDAFVGVRKEKYYSATETAAGSPSVWGVDLFNGNVETAGKADPNEFYFAWPVRGGQ